MKVYRVKNWKELFENNRTRDLKQMEWVKVPNKHDGDGYTELLDHPNGMAHYGAWVLILEVASKCDFAAPSCGMAALPCDRRGTLIRDGNRPHDAASLARQTRGSREVFDEAIQRLVAIGWLEVLIIDSDGVAENPAPSCGETAPNCGNPAPRCAEVPIERNGIEGNIAALNNLPRLRPQSWPTLEQVKAKAEMIILPESEAEAFWNHFESTGWKDKNGHDVHNWQSKLGSWKAHYESKEAEKRTKAAAGVRTIGNRPPSVFEMKTAKEAKESLMAAIKNEYCGEGLSGWYDDAKRREYNGLKREVDELTKQLAKAI